MEHDPSVNSSSSCHVGADILNLLFLYGIFIFLYTHVLNAKI